MTVNSFISRIRPNKKRQAVWQYLTGNYRVCEFALTNICVSKCSFCAIWQQQPKVTVDKEKAFTTIDTLADIGVRFITLTGGEPLVHPDVAEFVARCSERGVVSAVLDADPRLVTDEKIEKLKAAGLDLLCISIDHHTDEIEYQSRKIENLLQHIGNALSKLRQAEITTMASVLISNFNHRELQALFDKCGELGFDFIGINYPEHSLSPVYQLGGEMVKLSAEETVAALREVIRLKEKGYPVFNTPESINNIIKYLRNEKVDYYCRGGDRVLFVDWFFNVYPCMHLAGSLGPVFDLSREKLLKTRCNACNMSWYRDFSIYFDGIKSVKALTRTL